MKRGLVFVVAALALSGMATNALACRNPPPQPPEEVLEARVIEGADAIALGVTERMPGTEIHAEVRPVEALRGSPPALIVVGDEIVVTDCPSRSVPNLPWRWEAGDEVLVVMTVQDGELRPYDISLLSSARGQRLLARARASITAPQ